MVGKATWKWNASNEAYLTAKGESAINPRARVYACAARPRGSRYIWTVYAHGRAIAVCADTGTALRLGREFSEEPRQWCMRCRTRHLTTTPHDT